MLIDTHAHLDFKEFDQDRDQVIQRAFKEGIRKIVNVGCNLERSKNSIKLAQNYRQIYASVGVHPYDVGKYSRQILRTELEKLAKQDKVVAIGECGLDYFRLEKKEERKKQKEFFKLQLDLARKLDLPIIIHCRDAFEDLLEILQFFISHKSFAIRGVTHCFSGTLSCARKFLDLGFFISFTGSITYARPRGEILKVLRQVPLKRIMIETDCPYLAPVPHRGERNEPTYVKFVAEKIAEVKNIPFSEVANTTTRNAQYFFRI